MLREHEQTLIDSVTADERQNLRPGDVSVVVHVHPDGEAYAVEFLTLNGTTMLPFQALEFTSAELTHARYMEISAFRSALIENSLPLAVHSSAVTRSTEMVCSSLT